MNHSSNPQTSTWSATALAKNGAGYRFVCRCHCTSRSA